MHSKHRAAVEAEIEHLADLGLNELRDFWALRLGPPPRAQGLHLLHRWLAYELQCRAAGDVRPETRRRLRRLYETFQENPDHTPPTRTGLQPGTVLTRDWQGTTHQVSVAADGFDYRGERFGSLSEVARRITGTRWSGPLFFGLKDKP